MARYLLDTNVLLRAAAPGSAHYAAAVGAIRRLLAAGEELLLAPQILVEFWSVVTRPIEVNGYGWTPKDAEANVVKLLHQFSLLPETPEVFPEWLRLVSRYEIRGKKVHDARLVAMLTTHGVTHLLTFNVGDFRPYGRWPSRPRSSESLLAPTWAKAHATLTACGGWHWLASAFSRWSLQHGTAGEVSPRLVAKHGIFPQGAK